MLETGILKKWIPQQCKNQQVEETEKYHCKEPITAINPQSKIIYNIVTFVIYIHVLLKNYASIPFYFIVTATGLFKNSLVWFIPS